MPNKKNKHELESSISQFLQYQAEDGKLKQNTNLNIQNIYEEGELQLIKSKTKQKSSHKGRKHEDS